MQLESARVHTQRRIAELDIDRTSWWPHWREMNDYLLPRAGRFFVTDRNRDKRINDKIINNTATMAVRTLSSGMMSGLTSPARPWFQLRTEDPDLNNSKPVKIWMERVRQLMAEVFLRSNLYTVLPLIYNDLAVFGTSAVAIMEDPTSVIRAYHMPIGSYWIDSSSRGVVDCFYRRFMMTRRQMVQEFGFDNTSMAVQAAWKSQTQLGTWEQLDWGVEPNPDWDPRKHHSKFKRFRSVYYQQSNTEKNLSEKGFDEFPILAPRWLLTGEDVWGQSPAMDALGDIKALQLEERKKATAIAKLVDPPVNVSSTMRNAAVGILPGFINWTPPNEQQGGVTAAYEIDPHLNDLREDIQANEQRIKRAFFEDLFLMIDSLDHAGMTATEIAERHAEKMTVLGPVLERLNDELFDPLIGRTYRIMERAGIIPPAPAEIQDKSLNVEYVSILALAQKMSGLANLEKLGSFAISFAQLYPGVVHKFNALKAIDHYGDMIGAPPDVLNDDAEVAAAQAQDAKAQQAQQAMAAMQQGAKTAQALGTTPVTPDNALGAMIARLGGGAA